ncbi:MAG: 2-amino-4-hydroxy-6-hydroxymethyldihydropteridine diphosphokinase [Rikenellaceae bacterium]
MKVTLLTGCNLGDKEQSMREVLTHIEARIGKILRKSSVHSSSAWGFESDDIFLNQALVCDTQLSPYDVLMEIWAIERLFGKERGSVEEELVKLSDRTTYQSRLMDIDIIFYDDLVLDTPLLTIPHPLYDKRDFVLIPLKELQ